MVKVLFICLGNICRSPMAEGVFRNLVKNNRLDDRIFVDSAGTGSWHIGNTPDKRAQLATLKRGIDISDQRSRAITNQDIIASDYLISMDNSNIRKIKGMTMTKYERKLFRFLEFHPNSSHNDIPDPYFGDSRDFDFALDLIEKASRGLLVHLKTSEY